MLRTEEWHRSRVITGVSLFAGGLFIGSVALALANGIIALTNVKITAKSGREFAVFPAGLIALIIDGQERFLLLKHPEHGTYEPVNGGYDGGETIMEGFMREIREEAGEQIQVRPITAVHTYSFHYDETMPPMISLVFLFEYLGGDIIPGDDMVDAEIHWLSVTEINSGEYTIPVPNQVTWVYERAANLYRLLKDEPPVQLQPLRENMRRKYDKP